MNHSDAPYTTDEEGSTTTGQSFLVWAVTLVGHLVGVGLSSVALALPLVDLRRFRMYASALQNGLSLHAETLALHAGLSALLWALVVVAFRFARRRWRSDDPSVLRLQRGSVMVETLIVLVPFLLLTSGIAQLAIRNVAGILADLALYQGARAAWVWEPEVGEFREFSGSSIDEPFVERRAKLASALALAPSAPSSFIMNEASTSDDSIENMRGVMYASFSSTSVTSSDLGSQAKDEVDFNTSRDAEGGQLSFIKALDTGSMDMRAARKLNFAYLAFEDYDVDIDNDTVGVRFTYQLNVTFPWFAYIFGGGLGDPANTGRRGWYTPLRRPRPSRPGRFFRLETQPDLPETW